MLLIVGVGERIIATVRRMIELTELDKEVELLVIDLFPFPFNHFLKGFYREAVSSRSPGLLQPWEKVSSLPTRNGLRPVGATALRLDVKTS
jgi:hypothetical protein